MRNMAKRLAVALNTVAMFTLAVGCSVEHDEDGTVDLGTCTCETKAVIWVNSSDGGVVTCQGQTWQYTQGVRVYPICIDPKGEGFIVHVQATGETWIEAWVIEQGPDDTPAYFLFEWLGSGAAPAGWPTGLSSEVHLPSGGTLDAVVPASQPGD